ncbi:MAG: DNA-directed RNA polymerase subunit beta [Clostridia bacterium]|nr:DNA-directed RNA polymerase subunit beta [Clostridia bacterium]
MSFSKINEPLEMPSLIEVQKKSFNWFLEKGLMEVLEDVSPITDYSGNLLIDFVGYSLDAKPKYPVEECKERDVNFAAPLRVDVRLTNKLTGEVKQSSVFMGDFPLMTEKGTFVINGAERVIVSQLVRSPGVYFDSSIDKSGKKIFTSTVIPYRGAWLEYETDANDVFYVRIDKNRKIPVTILIRALGIQSREQIEEVFGDEVKLTVTMEKEPCEARAIENNTSIRDEALKEIYSKLRPGEPPIVESAEMLMNGLFFDPKRYDLYPVGRYKYDKKLALGLRIAGYELTRDVVNTRTGEVLFETGHVLSKDEAMDVENAGITEVYLKSAGGHEVKVFSNGAVDPVYILGYDLKDSGVSEKCRLDVLEEIIEAAEGDEDEIRRLAKERIADLCPKHITREDILSSINYLLALSHDIGSTDDIDHLGNRRLRSVGELLQNQLRIGLARMDKIVKERMNIQDSESLSPQTLINIRPVVTAIREFFGSSPLSQFMDQNNPLAELTHKRRLSALGPGGLSRDRASFEVRDVHYTHYGRMCPIETPEGPNIGLISYLATYARISKYGFIETPYRRVDHQVQEDGSVRHVVTDDIKYMTADEEDKYVIAQANEPLTEDMCFKNAKVTARDKAEIIAIDPKFVDWMDVSPKMVVSVATAMIPFLENDDNSRALMGSNMQKQAVPLMVTDSPIVGTGMEHKAAIDSGVVVVAKNSGWVENVSADEIVISRDDNGQKEVYTLIKFKRSNQGTCVNQRPIVSQGDHVEAGEIIADGPATSEGEIALGKNALIGFMTWEGYNYEDAVLLNEKLVRDDIYTSIHIEEYSHEARDTKLGPEEITREIPNVGEDALKDLTVEGIIKIGSEVRAGDILVGKVTPKGETELTAEERLLRAIFGEKAREVRDTSLRVPHGESGIIVDVKVFSRENGDELPPGVNKVVRVYIAQKRKISVGDKMAGRHGNKGVVSRILPPEDMPFLPDGTPLDIVLNPLGVPSRMNIGQVLEVHLGIAAKKLGWKVMTPVFDGATEADISECLKMAGIWRDVMPGENTKGKNIFEEVIREDGKADLVNLTPEQRDDPEYLEELRKQGKLKIVDGKTILYDGRTGVPFDNPVTVGIMYYLKLHHLVDDKIHARSTGPYSLVTQQPLGGKAQFGGQRFGEMEVWALEAYGAAYTLQEILTVKSDDTIGRVKAYEAIVKGQNIPTPGIPEAFKVLVKELQALGLDIRILDKDNNSLPIEGLGDDSAEPPHHHRHDERITADDVGETVQDDNILDSYVLEPEDQEDEFADEFDELDEFEGPDDAELFAAEAESELDD